MKVKQQNIKLLDCTLRDGGYHNGWKFSTDEALRHCHSCIEAGIDYVEVGFRLLKYRFSQRPCAFVTNEFLDILPSAPHKNFAVMYNVADFKNILHDKVAINDLIGDVIFHKKIGLVRLALDYDQLDLLPKIIESIEQADCGIAVNLMKINLLSAAKIQSFLNFCNKLNLSAVYFADSLGALLPEQCRDICRIFYENTEFPFGLHAHDNSGYALYNSIIAYENGASMIDGSALGMGRGAGNTRTEELLHYFNMAGVHRYQPLRIMEYILRHEFPEIAKAKWGKNPVYFYAALMNVHPTYAQKMCENNFSGEKSLNWLNKIHNLGEGSSFKEATWMHLAEENNAH